VSGRQGRAWQAGNNQEGKAVPGNVSLGEVGRSRLGRLGKAMLDKHGRVVLFRQSRASWSRQGSDRWGSNEGPVRYCRVR
jgi:hypothetical protein